MPSPTSQRSRMVWRKSAIASRNDWAAARSSDWVSVGSPFPKRKCTSVAVSVAMAFWSAASTARISVRTKSPAVRAMSFICFPLRIRLYGLQVRCDQCLHDSARPQIVEGGQGVGQWCDNAGEIVDCEKAGREQVDGSVEFVGIGVGPAHDNLFEQDGRRIQSGS